MNANPLIIESIRDRLRRTEKMSTGNIAKRWRQLSGQRKWKGLLDPLDIDLRRYLIIYGQLAQVTYDAFNYDVNSRFAGISRYSMKDLFKSVGLVNNNPFKYTPVKYLYATSNVGVPDSYIVTPLPDDAATKQTNWIGYIAVATDEGKKALGRRDIAVAWRGTIQNLEWLKDFDYPLVSASDILGKENEARVHRGFHSVYTSSNPNSTYSKTSARQQLLDGLREQLDKYKDEETSVTVTGHSLGAALATLSAADIVANGLNRSTSRASNCRGSCPVTAFPFACPRTGDANFKRVCDSMDDLRILRTTNMPDLVPQVPPQIAGYSDVGQELVIDTRKSPYLKPVGDFSSWHNLEVYLHGVAGTQGRNGGFRLAVKRDIALVNKELDALKPEYMIPPYWWVTGNRAMIQQPDGSWKLDGYRGKRGPWELDDNEEDD